MCSMSTERFPGMRVVRGVSAYLYSEVPAWLEAGKNGICTGAEATVGERDYVPVQRDGQPLEYNFFYSRQALLNATKGATVVGRAISHSHSGLDLSFRPPQYYQTEDGEVPVMPRLLIATPTGESRYRSWIIKPHDWIDHTNERRPLQVIVEEGGKPAMDLTSANQVNRSAKSRFMSLGYVASSLRNYSALELTMMGLGG